MDTELLANIDEVLKIVLCFIFLIKSFRVKNLDSKILYSAVAIAFTF